VLRCRIDLEQRGYAPATINLRLAAVRRIAYEAADAGLLSPELAAGIRRVKGVRRIGVRLGNWLTPEQGRRLLGRASTARQLRNHAMVAMLMGARATIDKLAPHDLRRTCVRLCHLAGGELDQIQFLLGHVAIQTTERYLGCKQKLRVAVNDRLGIEPDAA
jgi:integrase